jgi:hypothetical protein
MQCKIYQFQRPSVPATRTFPCSRPGQERAKRLRQSRIRTAGRLVAAQAEGMRLLARLAALCMQQLLALALSVAGHRGARAAAAAEVDVAWPSAPADKAALLHNQVCVRLQPARVHSCSTMLFRLAKSMSIANRSAAHMSSACMGPLYLQAVMYLFDWLCLSTCGRL